MNFNGLGHRCSWIKGVVFRAEAQAGRKAPPSLFRLWRTGRRVFFDFFEWNGEENRVAANVEHASRLRENERDAHSTLGLWWPCEKAA
jgi:hypothetical protein